MRIDLQNADRRLSCQGTQNRKRDGMVAADSDRSNARSLHLLEKCLDQRERGILIEWIGRRIAEIGDVAEIVRLNPGYRMLAADQPGCFANACRSVTRTGAKVHA